MPRVALFLGAGASKVFGYPTTRDFVQNMLDSTPRLEKTILTDILRNPAIEDIEHVLQTLDILITFISNPYIQTRIKNIPLEELYGGISMDWKDFTDRGQKLKRTVIGELFRQYQFDRKKLSKVVEMYHPLFEEMSRLNESLCLDLFTTNYDSVLENYCMEGGKEVQFTSGFVRGRGGREFWDAEKLGRWKPESGKGLGIKLYKLHGSLDWRETDDGRIERVLLEERVPRAALGYKRNILIYPAQKDYLTEEPFRTLMNYFEDTLNQYSLCLVIGFSFRDPYINRAFLDFLRTIERKRRLIMVSPTASTDVKNNLLKNEKRLEKRVTCIDKHFGKPETFDLIVQSLKPKGVLRVTAHGSKAVK